MSGPVTTSRSGIPKRSNLNVTLSLVSAVLRDASSSRPINSMLIFYLRNWHIKIQIHSKFLLEPMLRMDNVNEALSSDL